MDVSTAAATPISAPETGPLQLTARALAQVQSVIKAQGFEGYYLAIRVVPSGCSGFGYDLNLVKDTQSGDHVWEQDGIRLVTDPMSRQYLSGTEVDFVTSSTGEGFKFNNPNAKSACGCGQSFST